MAAVLILPLVPDVVVVLAVTVVVVVVRMMEEDEPWLTLEAAGLFPPEGESLLSSITTMSPI